MQSKPNFFEQPVNNRYGIRRILKTGGFGSVYLARDLQNQKKEYAIKLTSQDSRRYADIEDKLYGLIQKEHFTTGFVKYYETGNFMKHRYLLMELIGKDLDDLLKQTNPQSFSIKTVLMIGLQVIDRLQALHKIGYLHRDVKPDNLAIGLAEKNKIIYLFDFGLALPVGSDIPKEEKGRIVGTLGFMSCRAHEGKPQVPGDDIESMIYTILYLAEGTLPWLKIKVHSPPDFHKIFLMKKGLTKKIFKNQNIPTELFEVLATVQNSKASEKVDYLKIKYKLLDALQKRNQKNDFIFDWCGGTSRREPFSPEKKKQGHSPQQIKLKDKKLEKMNEENQKIVQNDIYEVYKFLEEEKPKTSKKEIPAKREAVHRQSPKKEKKEEAMMKKRPASAVARPKAQEEKKVNPWDKIMMFEKTNIQSGPKIVINKTAKHKI